MKRCSALARSAENERLSANGHEPSMLTGMQPCQRSWQSMELGRRGGEGRMRDENDTSSFHSIVKESQCAI